MIIAFRHNATATAKSSYSIGLPSQKSPAQEPVVTSTWQAFSRKRHCPNVFQKIGAHASGVGHRPDLPGEFSRRLPDASAYELLMQIIERYKGKGPD